MISLLSTCFTSITKGVVSHSCRCSKNTPATASAMLRNTGSSWTRIPVLNFGDHGNPGRLFSWRITRLGSSCNRNYKQSTLKEDSRQRKYTLYFYHKVNFCTVPGFSTFYRKVYTWIRVNCKEAPVKVREAPQWNSWTNYCSLNLCPTKHMSFVSGTRDSVKERHCSYPNITQSRPLLPRTEVKIPKKN